MAYNYPTKKALLSGLPDPLRPDLSGDLERIPTDTQDAPAAVVAALATQRARFQRLLRLPDGGAKIKERVIERLRTTIDELEQE